MGNKNHLNIRAQGCQGGTKIVPEMIFCFSDIVTLSHSFSGCHTHYTFSHNYFHFIKLLKKLVTET